MRFVPLKSYILPEGGDVCIHVWNATTQQHESCGVAGSGNAQSHWILKKTKFNKKV
jgi:hypothetical protein